MAGVKKVDRVGQWIFTRLWNAKLDGNIIPSRQIFAEVNSIFNLNISEDDYIGKKNMRTKINIIRKAVNKKFARRLEQYDRLSKDFNVPKKLIMRWAEAGLLNVSNPHEVSRIARIMYERDYCLDFGYDLINEKIPLDINIWLSEAF